MSRLPHPDAGKHMSLDKRMSRQLIRHHLKRYKNYNVDLLDPKNSIVSRLAEDFDVPLLWMSVYLYKLGLITDSFILNTDAYNRFSGG